MSIPKEGSRDTGEGIIISLTPDVCLTPVGSSTVPVPYSVFAYQGNDANTTATVRMTGKRAHNMGSVITQTQGDGPGTSGGVVSGTTGAACHPKGHSASVRIQGKPAIRHSDEWYMNNKNTIGKLTYIKSAETFGPTPAIELTHDQESKLDHGAWSEIEAENKQHTDDYTKAMLAGMEQARTEGLPEGSYQVAQAAPQTITDAMFAPSPPPLGELAPANNPAPPNRVTRPPASITPFEPKRPPAPPNAAWKLTNGAWILIKKGNPVRIFLQTLFYGGGLAPAFMDEMWHDPRDPVEQNLYDLAVESYGAGADVDEVSEWFWKELSRYRALKAEQEQENTRTESSVTPGNLRVTEEREKEEEEPDPCEIDSYSKMKKRCGPRGMEAHHIVPDYALRAGPRPSSDIRDTERSENLPSLAEGMAICLTRRVRKNEVNGEHYAAHRMTDTMILSQGLSNTALPGTTTWRDVRKASLAGILAAKKECYPQAEIAVNEQFAEVPPDQIMRAVIDYRQLPPETLSAIKNGNRIVNGVVTP